jgi:hypothetical protein
MRTELLLDRGERKIIAVSMQDIEPILERNKALHGERQQHDCARLIADIPAVILVRWLNEEHARGNTHLRLFTREFNETVVRRKLADPDWKHLRVDR